VEGSAPAEPRPSGSWALQASALGATRSTWEQAHRCPLLRARCALLMPAGIPGFVHRPAPGRMSRVLAARNTGGHRCALLGARCMSWILAPRNSGM